MEKKMVSTEELQENSKVVSKEGSEASSRCSGSNEWIISIMNAKKKNTRSNQSQTSNLIIRKIPERLQNTKDFRTCSEPSVVSIGPYYHNRFPKLQDVEELKPFIANQFLEQHCCKIEVAGEIFTEFEKQLKELNITNQSIKDVYYENVGIKDEEFMRMMFLDGCFILYFILCTMFYEMENMGLKNHLIASVQQDLFLVENQLPFHVLKVLMSLTRYGESMLVLIEGFAEYTYGLPSWMGSISVQDANPLHLLDILLRKLVGNDDFGNDDNPIDINESRKRHLFHGVKELIAAGIHFRTNSTGSLRDINFRSYCICARLTLPRMTIERSTKQMFLNLIAHEACMDNAKKFGFTSYICFLDLLIDTAEDVKELRTTGILVNYIDSDENVAKLFNEIASDLLPEKDAFKKVKSKILRYLRHERQVKLASWVTEEIHNHFKSPWSAIALLAGIIVIALTFVQTYFTIFPRH